MAEGRREIKLIGHEPFMAWLLCSSFADSFASEQISVSEIIN